MGAKVARFIMLALLFSALAMSANSDLQDNLDRIESYLGHEVNGSGGVPVNNSAPDESQQIEEINGTIIEEPENESQNLNLSNMTIDSPEDATPNVSSGNLSNDDSVNISKPDITLPIKNGTEDATEDTAQVNINQSDEELALAKKNKTKKPKKSDYVIKYHDIPVKKIELHGFGVLAVPDIDVEEVSMPDAEQAYAIDPTGITFDNATVTVTAKGTTLMKCEDWNYPQQSCDGDWKLFKSGLVPGKNYTFTLTPDDPGFMEINISDAEHLDSSGALINNIFDEVEAQDGDWSEEIYVNQTVRVTFEQPVNNGKFMNLYLRSAFKNMSIEVYPWNGSYPVAFVNTVNETLPAGMYDIAIGGLPAPATVFDIRVLGDNASHYVEFDYIHDATVNVSGCRPLNVSGTVYMMNESIDSATTCFTVTADDVTLDCNGFNLTGDGDSSDYGLYNNGYNDVTVKNCNIKTFGRVIYHLAPASPANLTVLDTNITVESGDYGLYVDGGSNVNYARTNVYDVNVSRGASAGSYGWYCSHYCHNSVIDGFYVKGVARGMHIGRVNDLFVNDLYIEDASTNSIYLNYAQRFVLQNIITVDSNYMRLYQGIQDGVVSNFSIYDSRGSGIDASYVYRTRFENGWINNSVYDGFTLGIGCTYNNITNVSVINNGQRGFRITALSTTHNRIVNSTSKFNQWYDIHNEGSDSVFIGNHLTIKDRVESTKPATWNNSNYGNYWELYDADCEGCIDDGAGRCDADYNISSDNVDKLAMYNGTCSINTWNCDSCDSCSAILNNGTYLYNDTLNITSDISTTDTCIHYDGDWGLDGVHIECNGFNIDGDDSGSSDRGIDLFQDGITGAATKIYNCNITDFRHGIDIDRDYRNSGVLSIHNTSITSTTDYGLYVAGASGNSDPELDIDGLTIEDSPYGMYLYYVDGGTVRDVSIDTTTSNYGMYLRSAQNTLYENITITHDGNYPMYFYSAVNNNVFDGFHISGGATSLVYAGGTGYCNGNIFRNGVIEDSEATQGFYALYTNSMTFDNVTIRNITGVGFHIGGLGSGITFANGTIMNNTDYDVYIDGTGNHFYNNTLSAQERIGFHDAAANATFYSGTSGNHWLFHDADCQGCYNNSGVCNESYRIGSRTSDKYAVYNGNCHFKTHNCDSCAQCTALLNNGSVQWGDTLNITADLSAGADCIEYYGKMSWDGIPIRCNGHNITGSGSGTAIELYPWNGAPTDKMALSDCTIDDFANAIYARAGQRVKNITIRNVTATSLSGYFLHGLSMTSSRYIFFNMTDVQADRGIFCSACEGGYVEDVSIIGGGTYGLRGDYGIYTVRDFESVGPSYGMYFYRVGEGNNISDFMIDGASSYGIYFGTSGSPHYSTISDGNITNSVNGIYAYIMHDSNFTNIYTENITTYALSLGYSADSNRFVNNTFVSLGANDISIGTNAEYNVFLGNTFRNGSNINVVTTNSVWNTTKGNRWLAFDTDSEGCFDTNHDGVCDNANMTINANNIDFRPLHAPQSQDPPVVNWILLNATSVDNATSDNLTLHYNTSDPDGDPVYNITDWRLDGNSIAVLNMPFEGGSTSGTALANGSTRDYSSFQNNGTVVNATWNATGGYGGSGAYEFDGVSSYIDVPSNDDIISAHNSGQATYVIRYFNASGFLFHTGTSSGYGASLGCEYEPVITSNRVCLSGCGGTGCLPSFSSSVGWNTLVLAIDESADNVSVYLNGLLVSSKSVTAIKAASNRPTYVLNVHTDLPTSIGAGFDAGSHVAHYNGTIDQVVVYNRTLSLEQIDAIFNNRTDLIVSQETNAGDNWSACLTPNDGTQDGTTNCSNSLEIVDTTKPVVDWILLNASSIYNATYDDLLLHYTTSDLDNDTVFNITDWRLNGTSIALLNMPFEGNLTAEGGTKVRDYSSFANNGTNNGAVWNATGGYGGSGGFYFDGSSGIETTSAVDNFEISAFAWVYSTNTNTQINTIMANKRSGCTVNADHRGFALEVNTWNTDDRKLFVEWGNQFSGCRGISSPAGAVPKNEWVFVGFTMNSTNISLYINGVLNTSKASSRDVLQSNTLWIGRYRDGDSTAYPFDGYIDQVQVFNRTLSPEQVYAIYSNQSNRIVPQETSVGDNWTACLTPNDGTQDGIAACSNILNVKQGPNRPPVVDSIKLNATSPYNRTDDNLTLHYTTSDPDGNPVYNITDWRLNGTSIAVLNMPFEGGSNSTWTRDYSTFGNNGTVYNAAWNSTGGFDSSGAYKFVGGKDGNGNINASGANISSDAVTVSLWVKPTLSGSDNAMLWAYGNNYTTKMSFGYDDSDQLGLWDDQDSWMYAGNVGDYTDSTWYHFVAVWNGTGREIYVNGTRINNDAGTAAPTDYDPTQLFIGSDADGLRTFNGSIDEIQIFRRALSEEQIKALYNSRTNIIVSQETNIGDNWTACLTPNDGTVDGNTNCSNSVLVGTGNSPPVVDFILLNATSPYNRTDDNLTLHYITSDPDNDTVYNITDWRLNGTSIAVLNMPFEGGSTSGTALANGTTRDYSTSQNNATVIGATWNSTGGRDGFGAYEFDGSDYMHIGSTGISGSDPWTIVANIKFGSQPGLNNFGFIYHQGDQAVRSSINFRYRSSNQLLYGTVYGDEVVSSSIVPMDQWHQVVWVNNGSYGWLYSDGALIGQKNYGSLSIVDDDNSIGYRRDDGLYKINATIDDVRIFDRALSYEQILALNASRTDLIVSNETNIGDNWTACLTPNDGVQDGVTNCSNVLPVLPAAVVNTSLCRDLNVSGTTYLMNESIFSATTCFTVTAEDVTLDCQGFNLTGDGDSADYGIYNNNHDGLEVRNCNIKTFGIGVRHEAPGKRCVLTVRDTNITIESGDRGISVDGASSANPATANVYNVDIVSGASYGRTSFECSDHCENSVIDGLFINGTSTGIYARYGTGMLIDDVYIEAASGSGLLLSFSDDVVITNLTMIDSTELGISNSDDVTVSGFRIDGGHIYNGGGIVLDDGSLRTVLENGIVTGPDQDGISVEALYTNITNVTVLFSDRNGLYLVGGFIGSHHTTVRNSTFKYSLWYDINNQDTDNVFYGNHLTIKDKIESVEPAVWNNSNGGNYWELYDDDCEGCTNSSGFCAKNYTLAANNVDMLPHYVGNCSITTWNCDTCEQCSNYLNNGSYKYNDTLNITSDLSTIETCIHYDGDWGLDGAHIECNDHNIDGDDSGSDVGIWLAERGITGAPTIINNCNITDFHHGIRIDRDNYNRGVISIHNDSIASATQYGLYIQGDNNANAAELDIDGLTVRDGGLGIWLRYVGGGTVRDVSIDGSGNYGINEYNAHNLRFENISIHLGGSGDTPWYAWGTNHNITGFDLSGGDTTVMTIGAPGYPADNFRLSDGRIRDSDAIKGVQVYRTNGVTFDNVSITNLTGIGLDITSYAQNVVFANGTIANNTNYDIYIDGDGHLFYNNTLTVQERVGFDDAASNATFFTGTVGNDWLYHDDDCEGCFNDSGVCNESYSIGGGRTYDKYAKYRGVCDFETHTCDSCTACTNLLNNGSVGWGDTLNISADLSSAGDCIEYYGKRSWDGIPINCNGHLINGSNTGVAIELYPWNGIQTERMIISDCDINDFTTAIYARVGQNIKNITITNVTGTSLSSYLLQGMSMTASRYLFFHMNDVQADRGIFCSACHGGNVNNVSIIGDGSYGLRGDYGTYTIRNFTVQGTRYGLYFYNAYSGAYVDGFDFDDLDDHGIYFNGGTYYSVFKNGRITNADDDGINMYYMQGSNFTNIYMENISRYAAYMGYYADNNRFINNTLVSLGAFDMDISNGADNNIFLGNTFRNGSRIDVTPTTLTWNTTKGNRWLAFDTDSEGCHDVNNDSVCDNASMVIDANNIDYRPLYTGRGAVDVTIESVVPNWTTLLNRSIYLIARVNDTPDWVNFTVIDPTNKKRLFEASGVENPAGYWNSPPVLLNITGRYNFTVRSYNPFDNDTYIGSFYAYELSMVNYTPPEGIFEPFNPALTDGNRIDTFSIRFRNLTIVPSANLECRIRLPDGSDLVVNTTSALAVNGNYSLNYTVTAGDVFYNDPVSGYQPWILKNCSIYVDGARVDTVSRKGRIYTHPATLWDISEVTRAVACEGTPGVYFNNTAKCDFNQDTLFAFQFRNGNPVNWTCINRPGAACSDNYCNGIMFPTCDPLEYFPGYSVDTDDPNGYATFTAQVGSGAGSYSVPIAYTFYTNSSIGNFKVRLDQYLSAKTFSITLYNLTNVSGATVYGENTGGGITSVTPQGDGTYSVAHNRLGSTFTGQLDMTFNVSFDNDLNENRTIKLVIAFGDKTNQGTPALFPAIFNSTIGLTNNVENETTNISGDLGGPCGDWVNNDFNYIGGTWEHSFDCFDPSCHLNQGALNQTNEFVTNKSGICNYAAELNCTDQFDNDYDFLLSGASRDYTDCHDADCFQNGVDCPVAELVCNDSINNDWDYTLGNSDYSSDQKVDNDGTKYSQPNYMSDITDCEDLDCDLQPGGPSGELCNHGYEVNCSDGFNNDVLQLTDCQLSAVSAITTQVTPAYAEYDCQAYCRQNIANTETVCDDRIDNDWDAVEITGFYTDEFNYNSSFSAGIDCRWGGYGNIGTDYHPDGDCNGTFMAVSGFECQLQFERNCSDGADNDMDSYASGMYKANWNLNQAGYAAFFGQPYVNDADYDDYDCINGPKAIHDESINASFCFDGVDNDLDKYFWNGTTYEENTSTGIDCFDPDCMGVVNPSDPNDICLYIEYNATDPFFYQKAWPGMFCANGRDDDANGFTDCGDPNCFLQFNFCSAGPCYDQENISWTSCYDGVDNNYVNGTDCADVTCKGMPGASSGALCGLTETLCYDDLDNDDNTFTDCADAACPDRVGGSVNNNSVYCRAAESTVADCFDGFDNDRNGFLDCYDAGCNSACGLQTISGSTPLNLPTYTGQISISGTTFAYVKQSTRRIKNNTLYNITLKMTNSSTNAQWTLGTGLNQFDISVFNTSTAALSGPDAGSFTITVTGNGFVLNSNGANLPAGYEFTFTVLSNGTLGSSTYELAYAEATGSVISANNNIPYEVVTNVPPVAHLVQFVPNSTGVPYGSTVYMRANVTYVSQMGVCEWDVEGFSSYNSTSCRYWFSPVVEGSVDVNITPHDRYNNVGATLSDTYDVNILPSMSSISVDKAAPFYNQSSETVALDVNFDVVATDTLGSCTAFARNESGNLTRLATVPATGDNCTFAALNIGALPDGEYSLFVRVTETTENDIVDSEPTMMYACTQVISGACAFADFDDSGRPDQCPDNPVPLVKDAAADPASADQGNAINISANVTDDVLVSWVKVNVTYPLGTSRMFNTSNVSTIYSFLFNDSLQTGVYYARIIARDNTGGVNSSVIVNFTITVPAGFGNSSTNITYPATGSKFVANIPFNMSINVTAVLADLEGCNSTLLVGDPAVANSTSYSYWLGDISSGDTESFNFLITGIATGSASLEVLTVCEKGGSSSDSIVLSFNATSEFRTAPIQYAPSSPHVGQTVDVNATAINDGSFAVTGLNVSFYVDGVLENSTLVNLSLGETKIVPFTWAAAAGPHVLKVALDPKGLLPDVNRSNNNATADINGSRILAIDATLPVPHEAIRGKRTFALPDEDRENIVPDMMPFRGVVYDLLNASYKVAGANCSFYLNGSIIGSNLTNASGVCGFSFNKTQYAPYDYSVWINFTPPAGPYYTNSSLDEDNSSFTLVKVLTDIIPLNDRLVPGLHYNEGDAAVANVTITKDGVLFDPFDVEVIMYRTHGASQSCTLTGACDGYYIRDNNGSYRFVFEVIGGAANQSLYWHAYPRNASGYVGSAHHTDITVFDATGTLNTSIVDKAMNFLPNSTLIMRDAAGYVLVNSTLGYSYERPVTLYDTYYMYVADNVSNFVEFHDLMPVSSSDMIVQFVHNESVPASIVDNTDIIGMQQANNFTNATVRIFKKPGMRGIDKILYCPAWNVSTASCDAAWQINASSSWPGFVQTPAYIQFRVSTFSAFAGGAGFNSNLTIWDETDGHMPYANKTVYVNQQLRFFANFTNSSSGEVLDSSIANCTFSENSTGMWSLPALMVFNSTLGVFTYNKSFPVAGTYSFNISCYSPVYDNLSAVDNFTILSDPFAPKIVLHAPAPNFRTALSMIRFNWSVTDNSALLLTCNLTIDGVVNATRIVPNGSWVNITVSGFSDGLHDWNVTCVDGAGNANTSATRRFMTGYRPSGGGGGGGGGGSAAVVIEEEQEFLAPVPSTDMPYFGGFKFRDTVEQPEVVREEQVEEVRQVEEVEETEEDFADLPMKQGRLALAWAEYGNYALLVFVVLMALILLVIHRRHALREAALSFRYSASRSRLSSHSAELKRIDRKFRRIKKKLKSFK